MRRSFCVLSLVLLFVSPALAQQRKAAEPAPTVDAGVKQVEEGDFEAAIKSLERALQAIPDTAATSRDRAKAYLYMAIAYLGMSEEANARARFADALKQDRELALNPRQFSPRVLALFEQAKRDASGPPAATRPVGGGASQHDAVFLIAVKGGDFAAVSQMLKEDPALVSIRDPQFGATPLHWAALKGQDVVVGLLLAQGADPGAINKAGETPLKVAQRQVAAQKDHDSLEARRRASTVRLLQQHEDRIFAAIKIGDVATVREMLDRDPSLLNRRDAVFGATPLHWAALKGQEAVVGLLLARGADATLVNSAGETPLQVATRARKDGVVTLLQPMEGASGATAGGTAAADKQADLFAAAKAGDVGTVRTLIERHPSWLNASDADFGATPLHWAALRGQSEVISYLLSAGADVNVKNKAGESPVQVASRAKRDGAMALLQSPGSAGALAGAATEDSQADLFAAAKIGDVSRVRVLVEKNPAWVNAGDASFGATPLHWAALRGQNAVVSYLLSAGADVNVKNKAGETPLQVATRAHRDGVVALLQSPGAPAETFVGTPAEEDKQADLFMAAKTGDVARVRALLEKHPAWLNAADPDYGATALHWGALRGQAEVVSFLMSAGADVNAQNKAGETPLQVAQRAGRKEVVDVLSGLAEGGGAK